MNLAHDVPNVFALAGGTVITVTGTDFVNSPFARCRFGTAVTTATADTSSTALCLSPAHPSGSIAMEFANNNQDYTTFGVMFTYNRKCGVLECKCLTLCSGC